MEKPQAFTASVGDGIVRMDLTVCLAKDVEELWNAYVDLKLERYSFGEVENDGA